ncbi:MAG: N4-gp56 family major capsid protein [Proteobacteria bacterium]|nr:N4-gp56 family major capsid protein [Pseudomonadota bacterium]
MALTQTSDLLTDQTAFDRIAYFALRSELLFDAVADVMPVAQSMPGSSVKFTIFNDLSEKTSTLTEDTDVTPVAMGDSQVEVTLAEYGNAVNYGGGGTTTPSARNNVKAADIIEANDVRLVVAALRKASAVSFNGMYMGYIHPDVSYDLRRETGVASWRDPHVYSDPANIYNGEIGAFEGVRFIETPRTKLHENASNGSGSTGTVDVYATHICGRQALANAHSIVDGNGAFPRVVRGPVVDTLQRFQPVGWYWLGGYARFREASLRRIEAASSIGSN